MRLHCLFQDRITKELILTWSKAVVQTQKLLASLMYSAHNWVGTANRDQTWHVLSKPPLLLAHQHSPYSTAKPTSVCTITKHAPQTRMAPSFFLQGHGDSAGPW